jgi:hypothetical protein
MPAHSNGGQVYMISGLAMKRSLALISADIGSGARRRKLRLVFVN